MSLASQVSELRAYRDILDLKYRYCWAIDRDEVEALVSTFTEDGVLSVKRFEEPEPYLRREGREELRELVRRRQDDLDRTLLQHRPYNPLIDVDGDIASGRWYFTRVAKKADGTVEFEFGEYHDSYRRVDGAWQIEHCSIEYLEVVPELVR